MYNSFRDNTEGSEIPNLNSGDKDKRKEAFGKKKLLFKLYLMSFCLVTGLRQEDYTNMLVISGLLKKNTRSEGYMINANEWKNLVLYFILMLNLMG